jgi:hypothetical protein
MDLFFVVEKKRPEEALFYAYKKKAIEKNLKRIAGLASNKKASKYEILTLKYTNFLEIYSPYISLTKSA